MDLKDFDQTRIFTDKPIKTQHGLLIPLWKLQHGSPLKILLKNTKMRFFENDWGNSLQMEINSCDFPFLDKLKTHILISTNVDDLEDLRKLRSLKILKNGKLWGKANAIISLTPNQLYVGDVVVTLKHVFIGSKATLTCIVNEVVVTSSRKVAKQLSYFPEYNDL